METIAITVFLVACGSWLGAILFHSAVVAPATFRQLPADLAGAFLRTLFPRFFVFGLICGSAMVAASGVLLLWQTSIESPHWPFLGALFMVGLEAISLAMVPAINRARDEGRTAAFGRLHGVNVLLTLVILAVGVALLVLFSR